MSGAEIKPPIPARSFPMRIAVRLIQLGALGVAAASLLGHLSRHHFLLELFSHFRVQYAALLIGAAMLLLIVRSRRLAALALLGALLDVALIAPRLLPQARAEAMPGASAIRLLVQNVNTSNSHFHRVLELIERENPDVILLLEVDQRWMEAMRPLDAAYPHSISSPRTDNFGIALWSRIELRDARIEPMTDSRVPTIVADVLCSAGAFRLIGTHTLPPVSRAYAATRNEQLRLVARDLNSHTNLPTIVCGDLNVSPWSAHFRDLLYEGGLSDTARGFGLQRTWPASSVLMRIPIDHILTTNGVSTTNRRVGPDVGSDHLGLIADLIVSARP